MRRRRAEAGDDEKLLMSYAFFLRPALVTLDLVWASELLERPKSRQVVSVVVWKRRLDFVRKATSSSTPQPR